MEDTAVVVVVVDHTMGSPDSESYSEQVIETLSRWSSADIFLHCVSSVLLPPSARLFIQEYTICFRIHGMTCDFRQAQEILANEL